MNNKQLQDFMRGFEKQAGIGSALGKAFHGTAQAVKNTKNHLSSTFREGFRGMADDARSVGGKIKNTSSNAFTGISDGINKAKTGLKNEVLDFRAQASGKNREVFDRQLAARETKGITDATRRGAKAKDINNEQFQHFMRNI